MAECCDDLVWPPKIEISAVKTNPNGRFSPFCSCTWCLWDLIYDEVIPWLHLRSRPILILKTYVSGFNINMQWMSSQFCVVFHRRVFDFWGLGMIGCSFCDKSLTRNMWHLMRDSISLDGQVELFWMCPHRLCRMFMESIWNSHPNFWRVWG